MDIVGRIRQVCQNKNIDITTLANEINVSQNAIYAWNKNKPSIEKVANAAKYLDVSIDYLCGVTNNPLSHKTNLKPSTLNISATTEKLDLSELSTNIVISFIKMLYAALDKRQE